MNAEQFRSPFQSPFQSLQLRAAITALSALCGCVTMTVVAFAAPPEVTPPNAAVVREVQGGGVQVYACRATSSGAFGWSLVGPKAVLVNDDGSDFGAHSLGPTWTALDGSSVAADGAHPVAKVDRPNSVPALLLNVTSTHGDGVLSGVRFVSRADTEGGTAPGTGCDAAHVNVETASHYSAVYTFYR